MIDTDAKKYISKKTLSLLALLVFCAVTFLVVFYVLPKIKPTKQVDNENNIFETVLFLPLEKSSSEIEVEVDELPKILSSVGTVDTKSYWDDWSWETHMIQVFVEEVDTDLGDLIVKIVLPIDRSRDDTIFRMHIECPANKSVAYGNANPPKSIVGYNFDFMEKVEGGDVVFGYCMQEECLSIGKKCILLKTTH